jgi:hypothetical protein
MEMTNILFIQRSDGYNFQLQIHNVMKYHEAA